MFAEAAQAEGGVEREGLDEPADVRNQAEKPGQQGQRKDGDGPGGDAVAAPAEAGNMCRRRGVVVPGTVEASFQPVRQRAERHQRMPAFGFTEDRVENDAQYAQHGKVHEELPQRLSNSSSSSGRGSVQPSSTSIGAG
ncbi:hypothetical protein D9M73_264950 [compost metagenome]